MKAHLAKKEKQIVNALSATHSAASALDGEANETSATNDNFDRLRGILDSDDPRFEKLHRKNIHFMEKSIAALSNKMGLAVDQFYARTIETYRDIRHQSNFGREGIIPQANVDDICPEMLDMTTKSWKFDNLPGVSKKAPKLI